MPVQVDRLEMAVQVTDRVFRSQPETTLETRLDAFLAVYTALSEMARGSDGGNAETIDVAWSLVEDAFPRGGALDDVLVALEQAHAAVRDVAESALPEQPRRPRRDA